VMSTGGAAWGEFIKDLAEQMGLDSCYRRSVPAGGALHRWLPEDVEFAVAYFMLRTGRAPTMIECRANPDLPHPRAINEAFGCTPGEFFRLLAATLGTPVNLGRKGARREAAQAPAVTVGQGDPLLRRNVCRGITAGQFLTAYRDAGGRFTVTAKAIRDAGHPISVEMAKEIATELYGRHRSLYLCFWPHPPVAVSGNASIDDFDRKLQLLSDWAKKSGHLRPSKKDRPGQFFMYQWLKNQELRVARGTMPAEHLAALRALPGGEERFGRARPARNPRHGLCENTHGSCMVASRY
jgi:hypothetical protein